MELKRFVHKCLDYGYLEGSNELRIVQVEASEDYITKVLDTYSVSYDKDSITNNGKMLCVIIGIQILFKFNSKIPYPIIYLSNKYKLEDNIKSETFNSLYDKDLEALIVINNF